MIASIILLAVIGFAVSLYTYITEQKIKNEPDFKPVCDISDRISCTKVMKSEYSNLFFFSNAGVGMLFYVVMIILALIPAPKLMLLAAFASVTVSAILAYILYFKIKSVCLLCTSLYVINLAMLILVIRYIYSV